MYRYSYLMSLIYINTSINKVITFNIRFYFIHIQHYNKLSTISCLTICVHLCFNQCITKPTNEWFMVDVYYCNENVKTIFLL